VTFLDDHKVDPPGTHSPAASIDCPECGTSLEVGYDVEYSGGDCHRCGTAIDEDEVRDQLTAASEPREWG
jgi:hypothetical protein